MKRVLIALFVFGITFGYVEASVVVYLRVIYEPLRQNISPRPSNELFPLITPQQLQAAGAIHTRRLLTELGREAATILMLAAVGLAVARTFQQWSAAFLIVFGVWDISFYAFLKLLIDWPASLNTWDLLFLLPVPWASPVIAPIIVSLSMILCGIIALRRPLRIRPLHWVSIMLGGVIVVIAFTMDYRNTVTGGLPNPFHWIVFSVGELIGLAAFGAAVWHPESREFQKQPGY
ncbi:MAG: hypothetical protein ACR2NN_22550 [Bryobacteraceae bacterium]